MENEAKLSKEQQQMLRELLQKGNGDADVSAFVNAHLTPSQAKAVSALLKNEALVKTLLASPQAKAVLDAVQKNKTPHES